MSSRRPTHQVKYLNPQPSRRNPPPIPGKKPVPENILRAREQIAKERNLQRAREITEKAKSPFGRSAGLSKTQLEEVEADFQAGVIRDEIEAQRKRDAERQSIHDFQNRAGRINSREVARRNKVREAEREKERRRKRLASDITKGAIAKALAREQFGQDIPLEGGEAEIRKFFATKYPDKNYERTAQEFGSRLRGIFYPRPSISTTKPVATSTKPPPIPRKQKPEPQPAPQPEPAPILEPEPEPEPVFQFKTGGNFPDTGKDDDVIMGTITKDEYARRFGYGASP